MTALATFRAQDTAFHRNLLAGPGERVHYRTESALIAPAISDTPGTATAIPHPRLPMKRNVMYDANYLAAVRRVEAKIGFFVHLAVYFCVNSGLVILNLWRGHAGFWLLGPLCGWGAGLLFHAMKVYWRLPPRWKQHLIDQELKHKN